MMPLLDELREKAAGTSYEKGTSEDPCVRVSWYIFFYPCVLYMKQIILPLKQQRENFT